MTPSLQNPVCQEASCLCSIVPALTPPHEHFPSPDIDQVHDLRMGSRGMHTCPSTVVRQSPDNPQPEAAVSLESYDA